jgi:hypothetical protein
LFSTDSPHYLPHHCSHHALNPEKGDRETIPVPLVEELLLLGQNNAYIVSSSKPIEHDTEAYDRKQPPHIQAKNCYENYLDKVGGRRFIVTMEYPTPQKPQPLEFKITSSGVFPSNSASSGYYPIITSPTPRAG